MGFLEYSHATNTYHDSMVIDQTLTSKFFYFSMALDGLDEQTEPLKHTILKRQAKEGIEIRTVASHHALAAMLIETDVQVTDHFFAKENSYGIEGDVVIDNQSNDEEQLWTVSCHYGDIILVSEYRCAIDTKSSHMEIEQSRENLIAQLKHIWDTTLFPDKIELMSLRDMRHGVRKKTMKKTMHAFHAFSFHMYKASLLLGKRTGKVIKGDASSNTCSCLSCFTSACVCKPRRSAHYGAKNTRVEETLKVCNVRAMLSNDHFYRPKTCCGLRGPSPSNPRGTRYINGLSKTKQKNCPLIQRAKAYDRRESVHDMRNRYTYNSISPKKYSDTYKFGKREYIIEGNDLVLYVTRPRTKGNEYTVEALGGLVAGTLPEVKASVSATLYGREKMRIVATNLLNCLSSSESRGDRWQEFANNVIRCCSLGASEESTGGCWTVLYGTPRRSVDINWFLKGSVAERQGIHMVRTNSKVFITAGDNRAFYTVGDISPSGVVHVSDDTDSFNKLSPRTKLWIVDLKGLYLGGINVQDVTGTKHEYEDDKQCAKSLRTKQKHVRSDRENWPICRHVMAEQIMDIFPVQTSSESQIGTLNALIIWPKEWI